MDLRTGAIAILISLLAVESAIAADKRVLLNGSELKTSRLLTNDYIGDQQDRWRTFSYAISILKPLTDGAVGELRFRTEVIAGRRLDATPENNSDRRMAGILGVEAYHSDQIWNSDYRIGFGLAAVGPQTGLVKIQERVHDMLSQAGPSAYAQQLQVPDKVFLSFSGEVGRNVQFGQTAIRPWVSIGGGTETTSRVGIDFVLGHAAGDYGVRDEVTGWRVPVIEKSGANGVSIITGVDLAYINRSSLIQQRDLISERFRLRLGGLLDFSGGRIFYGATYLSKEFEAQPEGQVVGSLTISINF